MSGVLLVSTFALSGLDGGRRVALDDQRADVRVCTRPPFSGVLAALTHVSLSPVQVVVPGTTALLQNLLPDTDYNIGVVALYSDGEGPAINDAGKTRKNPQNAA